MNIKHHLFIVFVDLEYPLTKCR